MLKWFYDWSSWFIGVVVVGVIVSLITQIIISWLQGPIVIKMPEGYEDDFGEKPEAEKPSPDPGCDSPEK